MSVLLITFALISGSPSASFHRHAQLAMTCLFPQLSCYLPSDCGPISRRCEAKLNGDRPRMRETLHNMIQLATPSAGTSASFRHACTRVVDRRLGLNLLLRGWSDFIYIERFDPPPKCLIPQSSTHSFRLRQPNSSVPVQRPVFHVHHGAHQNPWRGFGPHLSCFCCPGWAWEARRSFQARSDGPKAIHSVWSSCHGQNLRQIW